MPVANLSAGRGKSISPVLVSLGSPLRAARLAADFANWRDSRSELWGQAGYRTGSGAERPLQTGTQRYPRAAHARHLNCVSWADPSQVYGKSSQRPSCASRNRAQKSVAPPPFTMAARITLAPFFRVRRLETPSSMTSGDRHRSRLPPGRSPTTPKPHSSQWPAAHRASRAGS